MWRQALLYLLHAAHAWREPTSLDQVGPLCRRGEERGRQSGHGCLLVVAVRLGQDGDEESRVQNVTVRGAAIRGPEPVYTPCGSCACRWPGNASAGGCKQSRLLTIEPVRSRPAQGVPAYPVCPGSQWTIMDRDT
jgi:hypothetical protein